MSGIAFDRVKSLIDAHYKGNDERFRMTVTQIAAALKDGRRKQMLTDMVTRESARMSGMTPRSFVQLPQDVRGIVHEPSVDPIELTLPSGLQAELSLIKQEWQRAGDLLAHGLRPRGRLLFHGPPGNGKSTQAVLFARELGLNVYALSLADTVTAWVGQAAAHLAKAFQVVRGGHALVIDEFDVIGDARAASSGQGAIREANHTVASLLSLFDKVRAGLFIATTNRKEVIDPALMRRFDEVLEFPKPTEREIAEFVFRTCKELGLPQSEWPDPSGADSYDAAYKRTVREARYAILRRPMARDAS